MSAHIQAKIEKLNEMIESIRHDARFAVPTGGGIWRELSEAAQHLELAVACLECSEELKKL